MVDIKTSPEDFGGTDDPRNPCPKCGVLCYMSQCFICNAHIPANDSRADREDALRAANFIAARGGLSRVPDGFSRSKTRSEMAALGMSLHLDVPTTYPDGSGSLTAEEWVEWAKRELLYGTHPLPK
jgi:hypothetical protein